MKKIILNFSLLFSLLFIFAVSTHAQTVNCADLADCEAKLSRATQQIEKALDVIEAQKAETDALKAENAARASENNVNERIIEKQSFLIEQLEKANKILTERQTKKICILTCGFIKIRY